jgi:hypothetical protein
VPGSIDIAVEISVAPPIRPCSGCSKPLLSTVGRPVPSASVCFYVTLREYTRTARTMAPGPPIRCMAIDMDVRAINHAFRFVYLGRCRNFNKGQFCLTTAPAVTMYLLVVLKPSRCPS